MAGKSLSKIPLNLSVNSELKNTLEAHLVQNRRKGRRNLSELTENLWIQFLRRRGVKLPACAIYKNGAPE
jgi:hypothetical protein